MSKKYAQLVDEVAIILRGIPWAEREDFISAVKAASEFCWDCGYDLRPSERCHCTNDE